MYRKFETNQMQKVFFDISDKKTVESKVGLIAITNNSKFYMQKRN